MKQNTSDDRDFLTNSAETPHGAAKRRTADLFGQLAPTYDTVIPYFATLGTQLVSAARLTEGERVLDLACGRGACLRPASAAVGASGFVLAVDIAEPMVDATAADMQAEGIRNVELRVGDAEHLDLPDALFDAVVCGFGVFFFPSPRAALAECLRILRPGGRLAASTFVGGRGGFAWAPDVARALGKEPSGPKSPLRSAEGLRAGLKEAGFADIQTIDHQAHFVFTDVGAVIAWNRSHAGRALIDSLSEAELARYRELLADRLRDHAVPGGFEMIQPVHFTTAWRPTVT
jgi:SAM-dependent methyltransferase